MNQEGNARISIEAEPESIEIDPLKTAVIVVDMQNAFVKRGGYFDAVGIDISGAERIIGPCREIIRSTRKNSVKIIYFQMGYSPDLSDKGPSESPYAYKAKVPSLLKQRPELKDKLYIYGTWGAEIIEELNPTKKGIERKGRPLDKDAEQVMKKLKEMGYM